MARRNNGRAGLLAAQNDNRTNRGPVPVVCSVQGHWENGGLAEIDAGNGNGPVEIAIRGEPWRLFALLALERAAPTVSVRGFLSSRQIDERLLGDPRHPKRVPGPMVHNLPKIAYRLRAELGKVAGGGPQGREWAAKHLIEHTGLGYRLRPPPLQVQIHGIDGVAVGEQERPTVGVTK